MSADLDTLLVRLGSDIQERPLLTVVIGSGVTRTVVPDVSKFVDIGRGLLSDHAEVLRTYPRQNEHYGEQEYKQALKILGQTIDGQPAALTSTAVLNSYDGKEDSPHAAESDNEQWQLPDGLKALAELIAERNKKADRDTVVLTSNFDPLIEIALRRAGASCNSIAVSIDNEWQYVPGDGVDVVHFHGFWRGTNQIHSEHEVSAVRPRFEASLLPRLTDGTTVVCGYGGWDDSFTRALKQIPRNQPSAKVLWACFGDDASLDAEIRNHPMVQTYEQIDVEKLFPQLLEGTKTQLAADHRRGSPGAEPLLLNFDGGNVESNPMNAANVVATLDTRFEFVDDRSVKTVPQVLYWPVRLRAPSLVHLVQATIAGILGTTGMSVHLLVDDLGSPTESLTNFRSRVDPWYRRAATGPTDLAVSSLRAFLESHSHETVASQMNPWQMSVDFLGERAHKPTISDVLRAAKVIRREHDDGQVIERLATDVTDRLLTHATIWTHLKSVISEGHASATMTLGGVDEQPFWEQWRLTSESQTRHLYTPEIVGLHMDRISLRPSSRQVLERSFKSEIQSGPLTSGCFTLWCYNMLMRLPYEFGLVEQDAFEGQQGFIDAVKSDPTGSARTLAVAVFDAFAPEVSEPG